jgi:hypothetical protein
MLAVGAVAMSNIERFIALNEIDRRRHIGFADIGLLFKSVKNGEIQTTEIDCLVRL